MKNKLYPFRPDWMIFSCPFCGKKADVYEEKISKTYSRWIVQCRGRELTTGRHWTTREGAIKAWNTRHSPHKDILDKKKVR